MTSHRVPLLLAAAAITLAACSDDGPAASSSLAPATPTASNATGSPTTTEPPATTAAPTPTTTPPGETSTPDIDAALTGLAKAYDRSDGAWTGFVPNDHSAVIVFKDADDRHVGTVALNHPDPDSLGDATELDGAFRSSFGTAHRIENVTDPEFYAQLDGFDFHAQLGGVDSFAMIAGGSDGFFDPAQPDWASTWLHELFHRYQDEAFTPDGAGQDIEGYDYSADNIRLAVLEERALVAALRTDDDEARHTAARHFAALRLARLAADHRVALDQGQERLEGTARFVEHRFAGDDSSYTYHDGNFDRELDLGLSGGTKEHFGFGRFYATGSAVLRLATLLGLDVDDLVRRIEAGEAPADVLMDVVRVTDTDVDRLVAAAEAAYDPDGVLAAEADAAAARVPDEPPVFGDEESGDSAAGGDGDDGGEGIVLTDDDLACLEEQGVDLENDDVIPDEAFDACLAGTP